MEKILFLAHTDASGALPRAALEALGQATHLAQELGGAPLTVGIVGENAQAAADAIAGCGAAKFLAVTGPEFATSRYASDAAAAEAITRASGASLVVAPATTRFARALPGATQRLDGRIDTNVTGLTADGGQPQARRWFYRQRMVGAFTRAPRPWVIVMASGVSPAWTGSAGSASVETIAVDLPAGSLRTTVKGEEAASAEAQTIRPDADLLFVAGAGWTKKQADGQIKVKEAESLIRDFLQRSKASLGSSKSLVDQASEGHEVMTIMSHLNQVGQTGSTPRHPKGLATCCHGEEPHVVGWRFVNERRAINLNPGCGWAQGKADVVYVADAFAVMAKVNQMLGG